MVNHDVWPRMKCDEWAEKIFGRVEGGQSDRGGLLVYGLYYVMQVF